MNEPRNARSREQGFLALAIEQAVVGVQAGDGGPFGAVVVQGERVIAREHNRVTSRNDPTAHAEVEAIRAACALLGRYELRGCELYASCEPCPMCLGAALWSRVDRVWFAASRLDAARAGFDDAEFYAQLTQAPEARAMPTLRVQVQTAAAPFEAWATRVDRTLY